MAVSTNPVKQFGLAKVGVESYTSFSLNLSGGSPEFYLLGNLASGRI